MTRPAWPTSRCSVDEKAGTAVGFLRRAVAHFAGYGVTVRATDHRQRRRPTVPPSTRSPAAPSGSATYARGPTVRRPTAKPSASSARCSPAGPTGRSTAQATSATPPWPAGWTSTIAADHTAPSATSHHRPPQRTEQPPRVLQQEAGRRRKGLLVLRGDTETDRRETSFCSASTPDVRTSHPSCARSRSRALGERRHLLRRSVRGWTWIGAVRLVGLSLADARIDRCQSSTIAPRSRRIVRARSHGYTGPAMSGFHLRGCLGDMHIFYIVITVLTAASRRQPPVTFRTRSRSSAASGPYRRHATRPTLPRRSLADTVALAAARLGL